jgi:light-harvesting complex II chlorophyll a/b binding protein 5
MNTVASSIRVFAAAKPAVKKPAAKKPATKGAVQKNKWLGGEGGFDESKWYGADRKLYLPGGLLDPAEVPEYLDGSLAGEYGYDPLSLGKSAEQVEKYREFELLHGRWAMLGALGAILPEAINAFGGNVPGAVWWQTGAVQLAGENLEYAGSIPTLPLPVNLAITVGAFAVLEGWRKSGEEVKGMPAIFPNGPAVEPLYPGGKFDPLGLGNDPVALAELKVKEIKNGRLAMVSMLGFAVQALVTKEGPFDNWVKHLADPFGYNLLTILSVDRAPTL